MDVAPKDLSQIATAMATISMTEARASVTGYLYELEASGRVQSVRFSAGTLLRLVGSGIGCSMRTFQR